MYEEIPKAIPTLPAEQIEIRERFVKLYVVSYDAISAVMQMGYSREYAEPVARICMGCSYVEMRIRQIEDSEDGDMDIEKRRLFAALRREAAYTGPGASHAARVAALSKLASLRGMDKAVRFEHDVTARGGVMQTPGIATLGDWEQAAAASQDALQKNA